MSNKTPMTTEEFDQKDLDSLEEHEFASLIPEMAPDEFEALVEDIRENGLLEPIVLFNGQILDGRHRYQALSRLREEGEIEEWAPGEHFVISEGTEEEAHLKVTENVQRRHLTKPGLAVVACTVYLDSAKEEAAERRAASDAEDFDEAGESYDVAAGKVSGISGRSVRLIDDIRQDEELQDVWSDLLAGRFRFISEATRLASYSAEEREITRDLWEGQPPDEKNWKKAFKIIPTGNSGSTPEQKAREKMKRLTKGLRRFCRAFNALDDLPTMANKSEQKKAEYKNFLKGILKDLEEEMGA